MISGNLSGPTGAIIGILLIAVIFGLLLLFGIIAAVVQFFAS